MSYGGEGERLCTKKNQLGQVARPKQAFKQGGGRYAREGKLFSFLGGGERRGL